MDVSTFLKSHFGEDGSLARVLKELGNLEYRKDDNDIGYCYCVKLGEIRYTGMYEEDINEVCLWYISKNLYNQSPETQRKIAELLGWKE